jgi:hypothetical protein
MLLYLEGSHSKQNFTSRVLLKGIDKPKIIYNHIMENVDEKEFVRPTLQ